MRTTLSYLDCNGRMHGGSCGIQVADVVAVAEPWLHLMSSGSEVAIFATATDWNVFPLMRIGDCGQKPASAIFLVTICECSVAPLVRSIAYPSLLAQERTPWWKNERWVRC